MRTALFNPTSKSTKVSDGPEHAPELVAGDHITGTVQQFFEDLEGLIGQPDFQAMTPQLAGVGVELENAEAEDMRRRGTVHFSEGWWESSAFSPLTPVGFSRTSAVRLPTSTSHIRL